jgi:hypothetical protein
VDAARACATAPERSTNAQIVTATYTGGKGHNAAGIRRRAATFGYSPAEREGADACADYLTAKKEYLDYATALGKGWPIATGVIEGAARWLVKCRAREFGGVRAH